MCNKKYIYICNNSTSNCVKPGELTNVPCANWDNTCWYHWQLLSLLDRQCIFASSLQPMVISIWEPQLETMVLPLNMLRRAHWSPKGLLEIFRASWNHRGSFWCWTYPNYIHITQCSHCIHTKCIDGENLMERTYNYYIKESACFLSSKRFCCLCVGQKQPWRDFNFTGRGPTVHLLTGCSLAAAMTTKNGILAAGAEIP